MLSAAAPVPLEYGISFGKMWFSWWILLFSTQFDKFQGKKKQNTAAHVLRVSGRIFLLLLYYVIENDAIYL